MRPGEQCVITAGQEAMLESSVHNSDSYNQVNKI